MGQCFLKTYDIENCSLINSDCAFDCLLEDEMKVMTTLTTPQVKNVGVCQKNCGIDYAKCLITTFDMETCIKQEATCALDCLKSVKVTN